MSANIKIKNFQSIVDADITADGFTILVGESSQGKSACLRAISAACNNKFKQGFLRYGADTIAVDIEYGDSDKVLSVTKTKKESPTYKLGDTVYQKLNRTLPEEIDEFNNFGSIDSYEQKYPLNFFSQFSKPLLLEFSQKRILEILSSSKAFDDMNDANSKLGKKKEQNNGAFKQVSSMISENKKQLSQYSAAESLIHDDIEKMSGAMQMLEDNEKQSLIGSNLLDALSQHSKDKKRLETLKTIITLCERIQDSSEKISHIDTLLLAIGDHDEEEKMRETLSRRISISEKYIDTLEKKNALRIDLLNDLESSMQNAREIKDRIIKLRYGFEALERCILIKQGLSIIESQYKNLDHILELMDMCRSMHKTIKDKQSMIDNHICPICGNKIN